MPQDGAIVVAELTEDQDRMAAGTYCKRYHDAGEASAILSSENAVYPSFLVNREHLRMWPVIGVYFGGRGKPPVG